MIGPVGWGLWLLSDTLSSSSSPHLESSKEGTKSGPCWFSESPVSRGDSPTEIRRLLKLHYNDDNNSTNIWQKLHHRCHQQSKSVLQYQSLWFRGEPGLTKSCPSESMVFWVACQKRDSRHQTFHYCNHNFLDDDFPKISGLFDTPTCCVNYVKTCFCEETGFFIWLKHCMANSFLLPTFIMANSETGRNIKSGLNFGLCSDSHVFSHYVTWR